MAVTRREKGVRLKLPDSALFSDKTWSFQIKTLLFMALELSFRVEALLKREYLGIDVASWPN
jgi:hypothetical protein